MAWVSLSAAEFKPIRNAVPYAAPLKRAQDLDAAYLLSKLTAGQIQQILNTEVGGMNGITAGLYADTCGPRQSRVCSQTHSSQEQL